MGFERLPFSGSLSFAAEISQYTGCIAQIRGTLYECVVVDWKSDLYGSGVVGHALFTPVSEGGNHPAFPQDLLQELLASSS